MGGVPLGRCIPLWDLNRNSVRSSFQIAAVHLKPIVEGTHVLAINHSASFRLKENLNGHRNELTLSESLLRKTLALLSNGDCENLVSRNRLRKLKSEILRLSVGHVMEKA